MIKFFDPIFVKFEFKSVRNQLVARIRVRVSILLYKYSLRTSLKAYFKKRDEETIFVTAIGV